MNDFKQLLQEYNEGRRDFTDAEYRVCDEQGSTIAHYAAEHGHLTVPYDSELWTLPNKWGNTPAHWAAENGHLKAPYDNELWTLRNNEGITPTHMSWRKTV